MGGSLMPFGTASLAFATNSGSALVDTMTGLPGLLVNMIQLMGNGIADDITASLATGGGGI